VTMQPLMSSSLSNSGTAEIGADEPLDSLARVRYRLRKVVVTTQPVSDAMDKFTVDKVSDTPLYRQLALHMARAIREGRLKPGDRIPSERELADEARISRTTARLAVDEMVVSGLVYREHGRGTFVAQPRLRNLMGFASFTQDMRSRGMQPGSRILEQHVLTADAELAARLRIAPEDRVLRLVRLRLADGKPVAVQISYLPLGLMPGLEQADLANRSLFETMRTEYGIYPAWTEAEVESRAASTEIAGHLEVEPDSPILVVRGLTFSESFQVVESVETLYPGQRLALYIGRQRFSTGTP
jgi:GntR family transcriptional regulator